MGTKLSALELVPVTHGQSPEQAIQHSVELAQHVESLDFARFWIAEHHDMPGLASSAPEILIAHVASQTSRIRVGSGGIMLPNHSSLHIAEVFRTLEAIYPGRIDLGLGRAPGTDRRASAELRKGKSPDAADFPEQVSELIGYLNDEMAVKAVPLVTTAPDVWMLGSSDFGARFAAQLGLPYSFAQHFSSSEALPTLELYRRDFQPSRWLAKPKIMMCCHVICAASDAEAEHLAISSDVSFAHRTRTGRHDPLRDPSEAITHGLTDQEREQARTRFPKFVGSPETIRRQLAPFLPAIDELIVLSMIYDPAAKRRSYSLLQDAVAH